jgi:hypothetical protein
MPVPGGVEHREAPERLPMQHEPQGSCGSPVDPLVSGLVKHPGAPARRIMVRPDAEGKACGGNSGGESPCDGPGMMCSVGGPKALEPRTWDQIGQGSSVWEAVELSDLVFLRVRGCRAPRTKGHRDAAMRHGLPVRKSLCGENPMSGSGPSVSAKSEGEQTVEGVRNPEDGRRRERQSRCARSLRRCR